ncbi:DUF1989 domain-containing protein [Roseobacteraceae bacterium S113]
MYGERVVYDFTNVGLANAARRFPGMVDRSEARPRVIAPREAIRVSVGPGDLVSFSSGTCALVAFDAKGACALARLGVPVTLSISLADFHSAPLVGWAGASGGSVAAPLPAAEIAVQDEMIVLKAEAACTLWVIHTCPTAQFIEIAETRPVVLTHKSANVSAAPILPEPLGHVREEFTVTRGSARAYEVKPGEILQIIDVEGQQCSDFTAFRADALEAGHERMIDSTATRSMVRRTYPGPGLFDKYYDRDLNPILQVLQDTCGQHDTFGLACTARGYEERGYPGHLNCSDNISNALSPYGVARRNGWPAINFFWRTWIDPHTHHLLTEESHSRPGDYVAMRALEPLVCVSTACPDDLDPINGWNPTDVHVRIYREKTPMRRAIAYREKEDAPMSLSQESAFHARTSPLTQHFATARDLWVPTSFPSTGMIGEYWACRERATLQDMSSLRKYDIVGPDAERLLQQATTRDVTRLANWRGSYTLMCDDAGAVIDDGTLFRMGPELFRWCCGTEESGRTLETLARKMGAQVRIHALGNRLPNLALQGPKSRDILRKIVFTQPHVPNLDQMKWFGATVARLNDRDGVPFMLTRSGYTGELGYELFCSQEDAVALWDAVMAAGEEFGLVPMGNDALGAIRIEAGLAAGGAEFTPDVDAFEAGLGFAVDLNKVDYTGKAALVRNASAPRRVLKGLVFAGDDVPAHGAPVFHGERQIGTVTSATRSPSLQCAIAIARLAIEHAEDGTALEVGLMDGHIKRIPGTVSAVPFIDPTRSRARA